MDHANLIVAILCHSQNGNEYNEDLEMNIRRHSNKGTCEVSKHVSWQNTLKNRLNPIVQTMKKPLSEKHGSGQYIENGLVNL